MRIIKAKFNSQCSETGNRIRKGETIAWDKLGRKVFCKESEAYKKEMSTDGTADYVQAQEDAYFDSFCSFNNI